MSVLIAAVIVSTNALIPRLLPPLLRTEHEPKMWDNLKGQFVNHLDQINADLKAAGLPLLGAQS